MPHKPHNFRALSKPKPVQKSHHKHYWPYIPLLIIVAAAFLVSSGYSPQNRGVLAYATNVSSDGLLQATNGQRTQSGANGLQLNSVLSAAAQAKANDMVARNYWSHNTPEGQEPWVFISNAGYKYQKAGENLAYGFITSNDTVTGWMNSEPHRVNMLDGAYSEVGFGFANSESYNNNGQQTVVVAMYGTPQVQSAVANNSLPPPAASAQPAIPAQPVQQSAPTPTPAASPDKAEPSLTPVNTDRAVVEPTSQPVSRVQTLTKGYAPWTSFAVGLMTGLAVMLLLVKHAAGLRHLIRDSERFILHHPMLDTVLVSLVLLGSFLSQTTGFIR
ncbi:MAG: CAP domain-containing protein [Patescibacteria group bacterium]